MSSSVCFFNVFPVNISRSCREAAGGKKRRSSSGVFGFYLFKPHICIRAKAVFKECISTTTTGTCGREEGLIDWLIDWWVKRCGKVGLMLDCHPHVPFLSCYAGKEKNRVLVVGKSRLSWAGLLWSLFVSAQKKTRSELYIARRKTALLKSTNSVFQLPLKEAQMCKKLRSLFADFAPIAST